MQTADALRVLVVEDNADVAESFVALIEAIGHEARRVEDGIAALALVEDYTPDVAFLDLGLPGLDGYELARRLREQPSLQGLVIVAISGYGREQDKQRAFESGFDHHLTKPVDFTVIEKLLGRVAGVGVGVAG
jgi:CheY-like chemotaxis protein